MNDKNFATAINCIDGRTVDPLTAWIKQEFSVEYVDLITHPGVDKFLIDSSDIDDIKADTKVSRTAHNSKVLVIAGHANCAGNPVTDEEHKSHIILAVEKVKTWNIGFEKVIGVFVNSDFEIKKII